MLAAGRLLRAWPTRRHRSAIAARHRHAPRATQDAPAAETPNDLDRVAVCPQRMRYLLRPERERPFLPIARSRLFVAATICSRAASATRRRFAESPGSAGYDW